jgi:hypothetical protein
LEPTSPFTSPFKLSEKRLWGYHKLWHPLRLNIRSERAHAFTEQGVAMLSSVLNSDRAIQVNILIMRAFTRLRQMLSTHSFVRWSKSMALTQKMAYVRHISGFWGGWYLHFLDAYLRNHQGEKIFASSFDLSGFKKAWGFDWYM